MKPFFLTCFLACILGYSPAFLSAQFSVSGNVSDELGEPLIAANVYLDNSFHGTVTDTRGHFRLTGLKAGNMVLRVSYLGYDQQAVPINLQRDEEISLALSRSSIMTEEVIVRATRAGDRSPVAYSNVGKEEIEENNLGQDIPYLLSRTPSMVVSSDAGTGIGYSSFRIRGTDMNRINISVNGIPLNDAESHGVWWVNMPDFASSVDNVQIQRGVGTSTNGAAAFGATMNFQTFALEKDPYAELSSSYGSFNSFKNSLRVGSGLIKEKFTFDMRLSKISSDGYIDRATSDLKSFFVSGAWYSGKSILKVNIFSGKERTYQAWTGVPKVRLENDLAGMERYGDHWLYTPEETAHMISSDSRTYNYYTYEDETDNYQQDHYQLHFAHRFSSKLHLNSALHYTYGRGYYEQMKKDESLEDYNIPDVVIGGDTISKSDLIRRKWLDNDFYGFTYSLNYTSGNFDASLGGGWNRYDGRHFGQVIWARYAGDSEIRHEWYNNTGVKTDGSQYLKVNYHSDMGLSIFADVQMRLINHRISGVDDNLRDISQVHNYFFLNPKFGISYALASQQDLYFSAGMANREPTRSNLVDARPDQAVPTAETLLDYEAGYKIRGSMAMFEANLYYMDYDNQLVLTGEINDVGDPVMTNVESSYRTGIELVAVIAPAKKLHWDINLTLSRNRIREFTEYVDDWNNWGSQVESQLGETKLSFSPELIAGSTLSCIVLKNLNVSLLSKYVGKQYIDNTRSEKRKLDPYFVNDLNLKYEIQTDLFKNLSFTLLFKNIFNTNYLSNAWVYRYLYYDGLEYEMDGYFPQAGFHMMAGITLGF